MTALPTPANVPAGHVVRIVVPHRTYVSPVMSPGEAQTEKERVDKAISDWGSTMGLISFETGDGWLVSIRARQITAVEAGPPPARREHPQQSSPVHVHLHMTDPVDEGTAEAAAGFVPTPAVLAGRRQPR